MSHAWVLSLMLAVPLLAVWSDHCPIPARILKERRFPQRPLGDCGIPEDGAERRLAVGLQTVTVREAGGRWEFSGRNLAGRPWRVQVGTLQSNCKAATADYDRNGQPDLLLVYPTMGNGMAPSNWVLFLMFDRHGDPVPWRINGWVNLEPDGRSEDILDLNGDGRAEFLFMWWGGGYWSTTPYEAREAAWHRVTGPFAGAEFPIWTRFTQAPNRMPVALPRARWPQREDLSNALPRDPVMVQAVDTGGDSVSMKFSDGSASRLGPEIVILDRSSARTAYVDGNAPDVVESLRQAARLKVPVRKLVDSEGRLRMLMGVWR